MKLPPGVAPEYENNCIFAFNTKWYLIFATRVKYFPKKIKKCSYFSVRRQCCGKLCAKIPKMNSKFQIKFLKVHKIRKTCQKQSEERKKNQAKKYSRVDFFLPFNPFVFGSRPLKQFLKPSVCVLGINFFSMMSLANHFFHWKFGY